MVNLSDVGRPLPVWYLVYIDTYLFSIRNCAEKKLKEIKFPLDLEEALRDIFHVFNS